MNKIRLFILMACMALTVASCSEDELDPNSIFDTTPPARNEFDNWIMKHFITPFNIDLKYRFDDVESDVDYNVTPAIYDNSVALARLVQHLWMESYVEVADSAFLATYCPKLMHFVGSPEYEKTGGSMVLGTAEGGLKITLFNVNGMNLSLQQSDPEAFIAQLNEWYFVTMHHEFAHILHQTKNYSTDFNEITEGSYTGQAWVNKTDEEMRKLGFVSKYASMEVNEDFAETIAHYVVKSEDEWQEILDEAGETGAPLIEQKLEFVTNYLAESWNIDIRQLHEVVQRRQTEVPNLDLHYLNK